MSNPLQNMFYGAPPIIHKQAKELRGRETNAEKVLWNLLSNRQLKVNFRRQHPISQFIADFYSHEIKLVIEVDGEVHNNEQQKEYDIMRNEHIKNLGLHVIRFTNSEIVKNTEEVIIQIKKQIDYLK